MIARAIVLTLAVALALAPSVEAPPPLPARREGAHPTRCAGGIAFAPEPLSFRLRAGAFPASLAPDVAVHVPPGFDPSAHPGLVLYLHGWNGCASMALGRDDAPCLPGGSRHLASRLAAQLDEARVNALLVAVELRVDAATGEPGQLAAPGGAHALLHELFAEHGAAFLPCPLDLEAIERIVLVAHSGAYQAAAGILTEGDLPALAEVVLLDALYGGVDVFSHWLASAIESDGARFNPRAGRSFGLVDLYTCCGGTVETSAALADATRKTLAAGGLSAAMYEDDTNEDLDPVALAHPVVFKRVPRAHAELPRTYVLPVLRAAGFAALP